MHDKEPGIGRVAFAAVLVLVLAAAVGAYFLLPGPLGGSAPTTSTSTVTPSGGTCPSATPLSYTGPSLAQPRPVLLIQPGEQVSVCVTYKTAWSSEADFASYQSFFPNGTLHIPFEVENTVAIPSRCSTQVTGGPGIGNSTTETSTISYTACMASGSKNYTGSFTIRLQPNYVTPTLNMSSFTIVYEITPDSNATGYYDSFGPAPGILVSVGYGPSQVSSSDYPYAGVVHPTFNSPYSAEDVSVVGANVAYLEIPVQTH